MHYKRVLYVLRLQRFKVQLFLRTVVRIQEVCFLKLSPKLCPYMSNNNFVPSRK